MCQILVVIGLKSRLDENEVRFWTLSRPSGEKQEEHDEPS
jgi:hypothetical protein